MVQSTSLPALVACMAQAVPANLNPSHDDRASFITVSAIGLRGADGYNPRSYSNSRGRP